MSRDADSVFLLTPMNVQLSEEERDRVADTLRLAETLGGEPVTLPAGSHGIADDVIGYAHAHNVTQIIIGKSTRPRWFEMLHGSVVHDLVRFASVYFRPYLPASSPLFATTFFSCRPSTH